MIKQSRSHGILSKNGVVWARQGFEGSVKYPQFEKGMPASPVRGREGMAALATFYGVLDRELVGSHSIL